MATYDRVYSEQDQDMLMNFSLTERAIYGSSRVANNTEEVLLVSQTIGSTSTTTNYFDNPDILSHTNGYKHFELTNHLDNVMAVVSDKRTPIITGSEITGYTPELLIAKDYYPFGMEMSGRYIGAGNEDPMNEYRFGFNGQEKDDEVTGQTGSVYTAMFWEYDARIGRRWNVDPVIIASESSYLAFSGNPIYYVDVNGDNKDGYTVDKNGCIEKVDNTGGDNFDIIYHKDSYESGNREYDDVGEDDIGMIVEKGILDNVENQHKVDKDGVDVELDELNVSLFNNNEILYEFLAFNSNVEWGRTVYTVNGDLNIKIGTSHEKDREYSSSCLVFSELNNLDNTLIKHTHSHPNENPTYIGEGDITAVKALSVKFTNPEPVFDVLNAMTLENTIYDRNTVFSIIIQSNEISAKRPEWQTKDGKMPRLPIPILKY